MASTVLSVGGFRQQFSIKENVLMSLYSNQFIQAINKELGIEKEEDEIDVQFFQEGYLALASTTSGEKLLRENYELQQSLGATVLLQDPEALKKRFPWLNVNDLKLGSYGYKNEGWLDPWSLLLGFKKAAKKLGVEYINGEVCDFTLNQQDCTIETVLYTDQTGDQAKLKAVAPKKIVNACGAWSGYVNDLVKQQATSALNIDAAVFTDLPVTLKKRNVLVLNLTPEDADLFDTVPLIFDSSGLWVRRDGKPKSRTYLVGKCPTSENDPDYFWSPSKSSFEQESCIGSASYPSVEKELCYESHFFENEWWELLANRIPVFERCKVVNGWAGFYDYNVLDQNGIVGTHPEVSNLLIATGFSGHGLQQSPAVGRAVAELVAFDHFDSIDLTNFSMKRVKDNEPLVEKNIY